jgi:hypothetical protein
MRRMIGLVLLALGVWAPSAGAVAPQNVPWDGFASLRPAPAVPIVIAPGPRGFVLLHQRAAAVVIALRVNRLAPFTRYEGRITTGLCTPSAQPGGVLLPRLTLNLPELITDEDGAVRLYATLPSPPGENFAQVGMSVQVLASTAGAVPQVISCGDVRERRAVAKATILPHNHPTVNGNVAFVQNAFLVRERLNLYGLIPFTAHAQDVYAGTCQAWSGPNLVPQLPAVTASRHGIVHTALQVPGVMSRVLHFHAGYIYVVRAHGSATPGAVIGCGELTGHYAPAVFQHLGWWIGFWF